ncbi:MAG: AAA family ATPase [Cyanobacteria bacterium J06626_23]
MTAIAGTPLPQIPGYTILESLYRGSRTAVYRAISAERQEPVIVKVQQRADASAADLAQFRNQYAITQDLAIPGIVASLNLERWQNRYALIMEDWEGRSLEAYLHQQSLSLPEVLAIASQVAQVLDQLHQHGIIHKDIKPANLLIHPETKEIRLIDFSIASRLPKAIQTAQHPQELEGTLAYLAPEQTGRMNRGIDYRADFYSLGVMLYELLTGGLPFWSNDPLALVHCHIAQLPVPPHERDPSIPMGVSAIVLKLMAKTAEERYQSAAGLTHDLAVCLSQWQATGTVAAFELGQRDRCDQFSIPEKLYGRSAEIAALTAAFERATAGQTEMMLIAGGSGVGKTAVIHEVHKPITRQRGYFIQGKFDQFNRNTPFLAFVQAFRRLVQQLLGEPEAALESWKAQILSAVGDSGQVLIDVIPELENILGPQPTVANLPGSAAQNRFNLLFDRFIRVFTTPEHPLVIFLDDLQWADTASLELLKLLMGADTGYLLVLGAYRDNEVFPAHPLMQTLADIQTGTDISTLALNPLDQADVTRLVADTLQCSEDAAAPLAALIHQKTQGNPFFITQFLQHLYQDELIRFDASGGWQCDLARVRQTALTEDLVTFMVERLQRLPEVTQAVLMLAACIGNQFDLETLAVVSGTPVAAAADSLWEALQEGFIIPESETCQFFQPDRGHPLEGAHEPEHLADSGAVDAAISYRFLHDRVQQAAYSLIPAAQKQATHAKIGQRLLQAASWQPENGTVVADALFDIVNQLNLGQAAIEGITPTQLAHLNLQAGHRARASAAYPAAQDYYSAGIGYLPADAWQAHYSLTYDLHRAGAEAAYLCSEFERAEMLYAETLAAAQTTLDKATVYRIQMTQYQLQGRNAEAIAIQRRSLELLGWALPETPAAIQACLEEQIDRVNHFLSQQSIESILSFPAMADDHVAEMLRILQILLYAAWLDGQTTLALLAVAKMTTLSIKYGNSDMSPFGYAGYGLVANAILNDAPTAYAFGNVAVQLCEQFDNPDIRSMTNFLFAADVHSWSRPLRAADRYYDDAYKYGMEAGNWLTVSFMMMQSGSDRLTYGKNLSELLAIAQPHADFLQRIKSLDNRDALLAGVIQPAKQLLGVTSTTLTFDDDSFSEAAYLDTYRENSYCLSWLYSVKIRHAYLFGHIDTYADWIDKLPVVEATVPTHAKVPSSVFYVAMMHLALSERASTAEAGQDHRQFASALTERLRQWAQDCPGNLRHKCLLIEAETARLDGQTAISIETYDQAIAAAHAQKYLYEEALANELAARFYLAWHKEKVAASYLQEAYRCYEQWGAAAKLSQLEATYPHLLVVVHSAEAAVPVGNRTTVHPSLTRLTTSSDAGQPAWLDFVAVMKAAQAISQEVEIEALLSTLLRIAIANAGAETGYFILNQDNHWQVMARADAQTSVALKVPLERSEVLPQRVIYGVIRTGETAVFKNLSQVPQYASDPQVRQLKSVLCAPIDRQGKRVGLLYLENNLVPGAFTRDRVDTLQLLTSQAAISLENAQLYERMADYSHELETEVARKTQDLNLKVKDREEALKQLKATQTQLIQTEKMLSLGQLVAGVAHEINNPVNFIHGNINYLDQYVKDLLQLIEAYQEHCPSPPDLIQTLIEEIDHDFLTTDLPSMIQSSKEGTTRIREIVLSLRNFSRLDESELKRVDVHDGIESTLVILKHRLKRPQQSEISLIRDYSDLPEVECYPGQLNQVLMNLISNAIDALNDAPTEPKTIRILTEQIAPNRVAIHVQDNGTGIPETVRARIFDPFFTTKPVGQGTGMGLSISYQIVVERHRGSLSCQTIPEGGTRFTIELPTDQRVLL